MRKSLRNWLYQSRKILFPLVSSLPMFAVGQVSNYINNGGFENVISGSYPPKPKYWSAFDTVTPKACGVIMTSNLPPFNVPQSMYTYQWPRHGANFLASTYYCPTCALNTRGYPRNRLKQNLQQGETYCFTMYLNLTNVSTYAIDEIGVYFSDSSNDTIKYCNTPITYLNPQIKTPSNVYISDTLNWVEYHGVYTANGNEMYIVIGNFRDNPNTDTLFVGPTAASPEIFAAYCLDDISLININLPAFAGRDTAILPGSTVFLGRESDIGIDEACIWYKLPDLTNSIDTIAGFTINPTGTSTYTVRQELTCSSSPKWDTVVVTVDPTVGMKKLKIENVELELFPNPATDFLEIRTHNLEFGILSTKLSIFNSLGQLIKELDFSTKIKIDDLSEGVYFLDLTNTHGTTRKRFLIAR